MTTKSNRWWLKEHVSDTYVKQAKREGFRSRAVYKLAEIQARDRLFKPGMQIVELGAAPGGWSQYIAQQIKPHGQLIAVDLLAMDPIDGVTFIQGDFTEESILNAILEKLTTDELDWVVSDMAPNISGNESVDIPKTFYLAELALDFAKRMLKPTGGLLVKVFQGEGFDSLLHDIKANFKRVALRKPKASRSRSREIYILARDRRD